MQFAVLHSESPGDSSFKGCALCVGEKCRGALGNPTDFLVQALSRHDSAQAVAHSESHSDSSFKGCALCVGEKSADRMRASVGQFFTAPHGFSVVT